jgi:hypothetical protein
MWLENRTGKRKRRLEGNIEMYNMVQGSEPDSTGSREHRMDVRVAEKGGNS